MSTLRPSDLARACREVAAECEGSNPPKLGMGGLWGNEFTPPDAAGLVLIRLGLSEKTLRCRAWLCIAVARAVGLLLSVIPPSIVDAADAVEEANDFTVADSRPRAVVAPLRALADALDAWERTDARWQS